MADQPHPLRVLQVIGDTDPTPAHLRAVALHRELARVDVEVRTLALAPGRRGGLDDLVPVMAPSRRSWTLRRVLDREALWADVTVLHGSAALGRGTQRRPGRPPVVAVLGSDAEGVDAVTSNGIDHLVVLVSDDANSGGDAGPGLTRLVEPVDADAWRDLLTGCATRSR